MVLAPQRLFLMLTVVVSAWCLPATAHPEVSLERLGGARAIYAGQRTRFMLAVHAEQPTTGTLHWALRRDHRRLQRGSRRLEITAERPATVALDVEPPPMNAGRRIDAELVATWEGDGDQETSRFALDLAVHGRPVLAAHADWLAKRRIRLLDAADATRRVLQRADIPHEPLENPQRTRLGCGDLLIIGAHAEVTPRTLALGDLAERAARGLDILILEPAALRLPLAGNRLAGQRLTALSLSRRLPIDVNSAAAQGPTPPPARTLALAGSGDSTAVSMVKANPAGWRWLRAEVAPRNGRLWAYAGSLFDRWQQDPRVPRRFLNILQSITRENERCRGDPPPA